MLLALLLSLHAGGHGNAGHGLGMHGFPGDHLSQSLLQRLGFTYGSGAANHGFFTIAHQYQASGQANLALDEAVEN